MDFGSGGSSDQPYKQQSSLGSDQNRDTSAGGGSGNAGNSVSDTRGSSAGGDENTPPGSDPPPSAKKREGSSGKHATVVAKRVDDIARSVVSIAHALEKSAEEPQQRADMESFLASEDRSEKGETLKHDSFSLQRRMALQRMRS